MKKALVFLLLLGLFTFSCAALPDISAKSAILIETGEGRTLFSKSADLQLPMASVTKIMTALVAIEALPNLAELVTVSEAAIRTEGTALYLKAGERLPLSDLLFGLLLESGNDAANVIAEYVAGDNDSFVLLMNKKAAALSATQTNFKNPSGLPCKGHYSTAADLAVITSSALKNPKFARIVATDSHTVAATEKSAARRFKNHNKLLRIYGGCVGVKTGFTKEAGRCLVSAARRDGVQLVAVTLNAHSDWEDHKKLLDYGFSRVSAPANIAVPKFVAVAGGVLGRAEIFCDLTGGCVIDGSAAIQIELPRFIYAGAKAGDTVGGVRIKTGGESHFYPIKLRADVEREQMKKSLFSKIFELFAK